MKLYYCIITLFFLAFFSCTHPPQKEANNTEETLIEKTDSELFPERNVEQKEFLDAGNEATPVESQESTTTESKEIITTDKTSIEALPCGEAISAYKKLAQNASRSCVTKDDCIILGSTGNCDCYQTIFSGTPSAYSKKNDHLIFLHERIFSKENGCLSSDSLPCLADFTRGADNYALECTNSLCSMKVIGDDTCR